jgi:hypothetical protein
MPAVTLTLPAPSLSLHGMQLGRLLLPPPLVARGRRTQDQQT